MLPASIVIWTVSLLAPGAVHADPPPPTAAVCDALALPPSIRLQSGLEPVVRWTLEYSPTFRQQCRVLASVPSLSATVRVALAPPGRLARARAIVHRLPSGEVEADIEIGNPSELTELLAHEFEHLIEQLDGVELESLSERGEARRLDDGAFETRRAVAVGRRVAGEVVDNSPDRVRHVGASVWNALKRAVRMR
jgi:hypothetical protein